MRPFEILRREYARIPNLTRLQLRVLLNYYSEGELDSLLDYRSRKSHRLSIIAKGGGRFLPVNVILQIGKLAKDAPHVTNDYVREGYTKIRHLFAKTR